MQIGDKLSTVIMDMEAVFGLHDEVSNLAIQDFKEIRAYATRRFRGMSSSDKRMFNERLQDSLETLSFLTMQCGFQRISLINVDALAPVDESLKMFSIYANSDVLSSNRNHINDVVNYFSNKLAKLDEETLQNKNGICYRLQRLFVLCNFSGYVLGCNIIANFILFNLKGRGGAA